MLRFTVHSETKKTPFEFNFGREPRTKLSNPKNAVSKDSKDLSDYITQNLAGEITDHLVMSKKKTVDSKFYEKNYKKGSLDSKFKNKMQTTISGTDHTG